MNQSSFYFALKVPPSQAIFSFSYGLLSCPHNVFLLNLNSKLLKKNQERSNKPLKE